MVVPSEFVLGVDLDGVIADFVSCLRPIASEWLGISENDLTLNVSHGFPEWKLDRAGGYDALHRFAVIQRNLFRDVKPIIGAAPALRRISARRIRIRIVTHRLWIKYFHKEAVQQTIEWLEHYGIPYWDLCFLKDKSAVGADLYIEDTLENIRQLRTDGHPTIAFINTSNEHIEEPYAKSWDEVEEYVLRYWEDWKKPLN